MPALVGKAEAVAVHRYQGDANAGLEACLVAWHEAVSADGTAGSAQLASHPSQGQAWEPYHLPDLLQESKLPAAGQVRPSPFHTLLGRLTLVPSSEGRSRS